MSDVEEDDEFGGQEEEEDYYDPYADTYGDPYADDEGEVELARYTLMRRSDLPGKLVKDARFFAETYEISEDTAEAVFRSKDVGWDQRLLLDTLSQSSNDGKSRSSSSSGGGGGDNVRSNSSRLGDFLVTIGLGNIEGNREYNDRLSTMLQFPNPAVQEGTCLVCLREYDAEFAPFALQCNHLYCKGCHVDHLKAQIDGEGKYNIKCGFDGCGVIYTNKAIRKVLDNSPALLVNYEKVVSNAYIARCKFDPNPDPNCPRIQGERNLRVCPRPGCDFVCTNILDKLNTTTIECNCGLVYCAFCDAKEDHNPCTCKENSEWLEKIGEGDATNRDKIRPCPSCKIKIDKLPGCNHMTCRCMHEFCWVCSGDWKTHRDPEVRTYLCTVPVRVSEVDSRDKAALEIRKMERFVVYSDVYISLMRKEEEARGMLAHAAELYLENAFRLVADCCKVLKYSYVSSFNMTDNPAFRGLFEQQQNDLRVYVDQLFHHVQQGEASESVKNLTSLLKTKYLPNLKASFESISQSNKERSKQLPIEQRMEEFISRHWTCYKCTFVSYEMERFRCEMCETKRLCTICSEVMRDAGHKAICKGNK